MKNINLLITGATGLQGSFLLTRLSKIQYTEEVYCLVRSGSDCSYISNLNLHFNYITGDTSISETWDQVLSQYLPKTIIHIASITHTPVILENLQKTQQKPRLIIIGTTGVYSQYNEYSEIYKNIEQQLTQYQGDYCLLRPTMIYGSDRDKNIHKLIKFCDKYSFFPVFGSGKSLLQPVHADDLAQAIFTVLQRPQIKGTYDLSGGSVVTFLELLALVEKHLQKPVNPIYIPFQLGIWFATILENILGKKSPVRREQILRLQEDKAYPNDSAQKDLDFNPRSLDLGIEQEVAILKEVGILKN